MVIRWKYLWILMGLLGTMSSCEPEFEVFADAEEIFVVTGILNPQARVQTIKVVAAYQTEGDAILYASQNDVSVSGLHITVRGADAIYEAEQTDTVLRQPGNFTPGQVLYQFETRGDGELKPGERYDLEITKPDEPDFEPIRAYTIIPTQPKLETPGKENYNITNYMYSFPTIDFAEDFNVFFRKGTGKSFEIRVFLDYEVGGETKTARWGPTPLIFNSEGCGLSANGQEICYEIPAGTIPRWMWKVKQTAGAGFAFDDEPKVSGYFEQLSRVCRLEVTAVDSFLSDFLYSNASFGYGLNLLMDKPEISNISGSHVGVFGSINLHSNYINIGECAKYDGGFISLEPAFCN